MLRENGNPMVLLQLLFASLRAERADPARTPGASPAAGSVPAASKALPPPSTSPTPAAVPRAAQVFGILIPAVCLLALVVVVPIAVKRRTRPRGLEDSWNDPTRYTIDSDLNAA
jgi:hypothetical protein